MVNNKMQCRYLKWFISSFFISFALMRLTGMAANHPVSIIIFIVGFYVLSVLNGDNVQSCIQKRDTLIAAILGVIFCGLTLAARYGTITGALTSGLFCAIVLSATSIGLFLMYFFFSIWFLQAAGGLHIAERIESSRRLGLFAFVLCILCWFAYFLYEYPGVMTPDSVNQFAQVIGAYELSNHHSIVHTALIGFFYRIGFSLTQDAHFGLALYTLAQMFFMAFVVAYVVKTLQKAGVKPFLILMAILFYALTPYNGIYAVTMWKDVPFAGCFTLFLAALMRFLLCGKDAGVPLVPKLGRKEYVSIVLPYVFAGVMLCLLRTNGWYAFLASLPFILYVYRKSWKVMVPVHGIILLLVLLVKYPVMQIYDIKQADFVESLSIPIQQIARVAAYGEKMSDEQAAFVKNIMDMDKAAEAYRPDVSDGIKNLIRESGMDYLESHKGDFFRHWLLLGFAHPKTYLDAFVEQTIGFWYPDTAYEVGLADGIYPNDFGLKWRPLLRGNAVVKVREILFKLHTLIPLYGMLWSMGFMLWVLILTIALSIRGKLAANALVGIPLLFLMLTLIVATPVATEFRYAYALFFGMPLFLTAPFVRGRNEA